LKGFSDQPLRRQVIVVACLFMLPLAAGLAWSANCTWLERQREVGDEAASIAATAAAYIDEHLRGLDAVAAVLVRHPAVQALDSAACDRLFADLLREHPLLTNLILATPDGVVRGSALEVGDRRTARSWLAEVARTGRSVVGEFGIGTLSGKPTSTLGYPVGRSANGVIAGLGLTINLSELQTVFSSIPLPEGSVVSVVDRTGRVLVRSRDSERFVGRMVELVDPANLPRTAQRVGPDGVQRFYGDAALHRAPWIVSVGIPRTTVAARLRPLYQRNLTMTLIAFSTSLLFVLWLAQVMSRQLNRLRAAVQRIADGDLSAPAAGAVPNRELAQLQNAFVTMAANLRDTRDALDRRVDQERKMNEVLQSLQRQVVRQERLAAVGLLVSGVAHELNNPLQAILGTMELLERQGNLASETLTEVSFVKTQSGRAREIIRNLSRFSTQQTGPPAVIGLDDVVAEVVQLRKTNLLGAGISLDVQIETTRKVYANFTELEQVVLNFVLNAQQSIETGARPGGRIAIRVSDAVHRIRLEVSDDGDGVPPGDEPKLFQPFFTTKPVGKGTGLGLSVSYGIIDSYGGAIGHFGNEWGGATFFFELPAAESGSQSA
jgi:C4-dicarboxylate-specific signal transduction histidine kinase